MSDVIIDSAMSETTKTSATTTTTATDVIIPTTKPIAQERNKSIESTHTKFQ